MAVTCGFYNALNHDRLYDAIQMSSIFDGIIQDGVFSTIGDSLIVTSPEDGMYVDVGPGRAWFNHTWTLNDTEYPVEAEEAEVVLDRIDAVVLEVNANPEVRNNRIYFVKGTPSSNPVKPTLIHNAEVNQYALAYVTIRAGQTTIFQSDIENVVGTDETPFVTGLLQQVSVEQLLLQWNDDFYRYFAAFQSHNNAEFNTWMEAKVAEYNQWYAAMEEEGAQDLATFDTWFQHMKDQLDEDAAGHLQQEIDELAEACEKGSVFTVTTEEAELVGRSCVISQGSDSVTKQFDANGVALFPSMPYIGTIHVEATDGDNVAQGEMTVPYFGRYGMQIAFWAATLNISTSADGLIGRPITITKGGVVVGTTSFNASGRATYKVHEPGTYIVSSSTAGGDEYAATVVVTEETAYPVNLGIPSGATATPTDDIQTWLKCASIYDKSYTLLNDVLEDYYTCERLFSDSNACDYMARSTSWAAIVTTDASVMEQLSKYSYCVEKLLDNATWHTAICDSEHFKYILNVQSPSAMTSNSAPYGIASASSIYSSTEDAYYAFRESGGSAGWASTPASSGWLQYAFPNPIILHKIALRRYGAGYYCDTMALNGTNDSSGSTWTTLDGAVVTNTDSIRSTEINSGGEAYKYFRFSGNKSSGANWGVGLGNVMLYGRYPVEQITNLIHSAANDTIYYYDSNSVERQLCVTDANGNGTVDWSEMEPGIYTFYSTVAKNPDNLSEEYSRTVKITKTTTEVYLMPPGTLYWNGYEDGDLEDMTNANGWTWNGTLIAPTHNANKVSVTSGSNTGAGISTKKVANLQSIQAIVSDMVVASTYALFGYTTQKTNYHQALVFDTIPTGSGLARLHKSAVNDTYPLVFIYGGSKGDICALWKTQSRFLTVFSAANDTIYYLGENNVHIPFAKTDETGTASVDLGLIPQGTYTLYSTIAKDPDNLSNPYSKTITIGPDTKSIKVMPDGALYWYGWRKCDFLNTKYSTWSMNNGSITYYSNSIHMTSTSSGQYYAIVASEPMPIRTGQVVKIHMFDRTVLSGNGWYTNICARVNRDDYNDTSYSGYIIDGTRGSGSVTSGIGQTSPISTDGNYYPAFGFRCDNTVASVNVDWVIVTDP